MLSLVKLSHTFTFSAASVSPSFLPSFSSLLLEPPHQILQVDFFCFLGMCSFTSWSTANYRIKYNKSNQKFSINVFYIEQGTRTLFLITEVINALHLVMASGRLHLTLSLGLLWPSCNT